jgi:GNAT superfamily N-acetyltransferase
VIRDALETDAEPIALLSGQLGYPVDSRVIQERLGQIRRHGDGRVFVAELEGKIVGWIHVYGVHVLEAPAHALIGGLVIDEKHRGQGIGRRLMAAVEQWAADSGYTSIRVRSNVIRKGAHIFYPRLGYSVLKQQLVYSRDLSTGDDSGSDSATGGPL